ncbi:DUF2852 domain-containing protein [Histidinibacterium aquaticum]|uniref:DUF2852 domain-containing protein n=1 Tax=Histidinibacterium aquaticum TaxID=2613962 RepID=A0A5J5GL28_9RHOB|nr:DUF2852 domain-containing protein [Histidinibacterium aquaticum]KAA9008737.1 DUF2852 domain-containing protein [Histidinibacterium aquaticum]
MSASTERSRSSVPPAVQVLSVLIFGAFAIASVAIAFAHFWPAGFALAAILAWRGDFLPEAARRSSAPAEETAPEPAEPAGTGNASFDAYRADMLKRLEDERQSFGAFLTRLREAKDQTEFDQFMDRRARRVQDETIAAYAD